MSKEITWHEFVTGGYKGYDPHLTWDSKKLADHNADDLKLQGFQVVVVKTGFRQWTVYKR